MNTARTVFLMVAMMMILLLIGDTFAGEQGMLMAFILSLAMNFGMYWFSDKIVLMTYRAKPVSESDAPRLYASVRKLAAQAQIPMPTVYRIPDDSLNAFATGRNPNHAAVAVTDGLLKALQDNELEGVLAHELAHIKHRDILTGTLVATMVGTITFVARMAGWAMMFAGGRRDDRDSGGGVAELLLILLAPIAAMLIQLAISRSREYAADEGGAELCGNPLSLAQALRKLEKGALTIPMDSASPASAHLFIVNPLRGGGVWRLFSTHPPIEERISRLEKLAIGGIG
jgi:heat shock protein HtpX